MDSVNICLKTSDAYTVISALNKCATQLFNKLVEQEPGNLKNNMFDEYYRICELANFIQEQI